MKMILKKCFRCLRDNSAKARCALQSQMLSRTYCTNFISRRYALLARTLHNGLLSRASEPLIPNHLPHRLYSPATDREQKLNYPENVIHIQPVLFEDVTFEQPVSHRDLLNALQNCKSLEDQMKILTTTLALSSEDVEKRKKFSKTIEALLSPFFSDIKIQIFGSTVNGFGFKGCDLDMSFKTSAERINEASYLERPDVPLVSEVLTGRISPLEISQLPKKEQLLFIHSVLLEYYKESNEPTIFINAYVPLVRFYHDKYNLKCDLSCENKVAFVNTKLLYLLGQIDKRVIPLMMTVRYWAKHVELIGKGLMFNTYTISMLVIYFLQACNPPVLPSAEFISSLTNDCLDVDDMDDKSFLNVLKSVPPSKNNQSLDELLKEFFFFYLYFDFTRVVCPLIAASVPRDKFFTSERSKKFRMSTICVQDPMLETHNVAELVDYKHCRKFITELMAACKIYQDGTLLRPSSETWGLMTLFDKPEKYSLQYISSEKSVSLTIPVISSLNKVTSKEIREKALNSAQTLLHILEEALLFECKTLEREEIIKLLERQDELAMRHKKIMESVTKSKNEQLEFMKNYNRKSSKSQMSHSSSEKGSESTEGFVEHFKKLNSEYELLLCAECKVSKNTWLGRNFIEIKYIPNDILNDILRKEHFISVQAAKNNEQNAMEAKTKPFKFLCELYILPNYHMTSLFVNLRPIQRTSFNPVLGIFLKEYIPRIFNIMNSS